MSTPTPVTVASSLTRLEHLALDMIKPDPTQVRKEFHVEQLQELAESIRAKGVVQPLIVRPGAGGGFTLVAGERRLRAAKLAGLERAPCIVREGLAATEIPVLQLVENLQRSDLALHEVAIGVAELCKSHSQDEVAKLLGKSKSWVSKHAGVVGLPKAVKDLVQKGKVGDAEIALGVAELLQVDAEAGREMIEDIETPKTWSQPVTRDSVRESVKDAKEDIKRRQNMEAREKAEAARRANQKLDPQAARWEAERQREEARRKARRAKIRAIEKPCDALVRATLPKLAALFGKKVKTDKDGGIASFYQQSIYIRPALSGFEYGREAVPEHTDQVEFEVVLKLQGKDVVKLLSKLGIEAKGAAAVTEAKSVAPAPAPKSKAKSSAKKK